MVAIVLVNYQSYDDTFECIESIIKSEQGGYRIFVVDNSTSKTKQPGFISRVNQLLSTRAEAASRLETAEAGSFQLSKAKQTVTLVNAENKGFAAANNIILNQVSPDSEYKYIWLLNNDTKIAPGTVKDYIEEYRRLSAEKKLGILGCVLVYEDQPAIIQGTGGTYLKMLGTTRHVMDGAKRTDYNPELHEKIDYPIGASMLVSTEFLTDVGVLNESYFLYFEELDWVIRGQKKGWVCDYASRVFIQHKAGSSIGGKNKIKKTSSKVSDYYFYRNRLRFSLKHTPFHFPFVLTIVGLSIIYRVVGGRSAFLRLFFNKKERPG
jgi:GT2 family glycosyltransferase